MLSIELHGIDTILPQYTYSKEKTKEHKQITNNRSIGGLAKTRNEDTCLHIIVYLWIFLCFIFFVLIDSTLYLYSVFDTEVWPPATSGHWAALVWVEIG